MNLGNLSAGDVAIVVKVRSHSAAVIDQLASRGIHPGAQISVLRQGDPIAVALEETRWAMNKEHAEYVEVSVIEAPCLI
ncbi:MAG: FeoA family protein [Gammaproteobacteria bacterium]